MRFTPILLLLLPFVELYGLIRVGSNIGALTTIVLVIVTAMAGFWLLKSQGRVASGSQIEMMRRLTSMPLVVLGALFLIIPGVVTDTLGAILAFPPTRELIKWLLMKYFGVKVGSASFNQRSDHTQAEIKTASRTKQGGHIIEGEYTEEK